MHGLALGSAHLDPQDIFANGIQEGTIPVITEGTGRGKTFHACNGNITKRYAEVAGVTFRRTIIITPYRATKDQMMSEYDVRDLRGLTVFEEETGLVYVGTFSMLAGMLAKHTVNLSDTLLIVDEVHRLVFNSVWIPETAYLIDLIQEQDIVKGLRVIGMSGTPQICFDYVNPTGHFPRFVDATPHATLTLSANEGLLVNHSTAKSYLEYRLRDWLRDDRKRLVYIQSATECYKVSKWLRESGIQSAFIISQHNEKMDKATRRKLTELMEEQTWGGRTIRQYLAERSDVPADVRVLVINDSASEGLNIMDEEHRFDEVVIESTCKATIKQARARIRHDVDKVTVIYNRSNKERAVRSFTDTARFLDEYSACETDSDRAAVGARRLARQAVEVDDNGDPTLDLAVLGIRRKGKVDYMVNPFIEAVETYQMEQYLFSEAPHIEYQGGMEVETRTVRCFADKPLPTFSMWLDDLRDMVGGKAFRHVFGADLRTAIIQGYNSDRMNAFDMQPWLGRKLFTEDKREFARALSIKDSKRRITGWPTARKYLVECGYQVTEGRLTTGRKLRYVVIS